MHPESEAQPTLSEVEKLADEKPQCIQSAEIGGQVRDGLAVENVDSSQPRSEHFPDGASHEAVPRTNTELDTSEDWVYEALCDPWVTNVEVLLKAVIAVRTMPRVENSHDQYTKWMEEGLNYPVSRTPSQPTARTADAAMGGPGRWSKSEASGRPHFLKRSGSLRLPGERNVDSQLVVPDRPASAHPRTRALTRSASLRPASKGGHGERMPVTRVTRQPSVRPPPILLRQMFVDQALSYIGTPYIRSSASLGKATCRQLPSRLKPAAPVAGAHDKWSLALDCSALVRQCLFDLQRYFGFCIGGWNQAYQFDTLPLAVPTLDDLRPGDLIFISGKYFDAARTPKPHDMTHVEIYFPLKAFGSTQTIGSRHRHGCVQVHADYRFESRTYYDMQYHFRSIDTWLQGTCRSHCKQHRWQNG